MEELLKELAEAEQKIAEIEKKIEEKKAETGRWKPKEGEAYWSIDSCGQVMYDIWHNYLIDSMRYKIDNCYKTEEEAEFVAEKLKVIAELKEFAEPKNRVWDGMNYHYYFSFDYQTNKVVLDVNWQTKRSHIYFESKAKARQAINAVGEKRIKKYYLEVEE